MAISDAGRYAAVSEPCRNFNILGSLVLIDPKDGKEKFVLSNFAAGALGNLIFIDTETGEGESVKLPGDNGAWALLNYNNEKILVGTCATNGYLLSLDLKTRTWAEPLRDQNETYIWNLTLGSDGMVYGGTYPGNVLLQYNPKEHVLKNLGKVTANVKDLYSRMVYGENPGYIMVTGGFDKPYLVAWDIDAKSFKTVDTYDPSKPIAMKEINDKFICLSSGDDLFYYDSKTLEPIDKAKTQNLHVNSKPGRVKVLRDGRIIGVRGQDYFIKQNADDKPQYIRIPTPAPATHIHTITCESKGTIWGACGFGQTIFKYEPKDGSYWNSSIVCNNGGEVYGMAFVENKLFLTAYSGGDHMVYYPDQEWNQLDNINPKTIETLGPKKLIRPLSRSVVGTGNSVWTGWAASYGTYGGGLSKINTDTLKVEYWYDPVPEQQISSISADENYVYFATHGGGNGLSTRNIPCHFVVWAPEGKLIFDKIVEKAVGPLYAIGEKVFVGDGNNLKVFCPDKMSFTDNIPLDSPCGCIIGIDSDTLGLFLKDSFYLLNTVSMILTFVSKVPERVHTAITAPDGDIYFAAGTVLYKLTI